MRTRSHKPDTGIRRKRNGWQAFVEVDGQFRSKQFALDTPVETMRAWRECQAAGETDMEDDLVRTILRDPKFLKKLEQFVREALSDAVQREEAIEAAYGAAILESVRARLWPTEPS